MVDYDRSDGAWNENLSIVVNIAVLVAWILDIINWKLFVRDESMLHS